jgi:hypothetical protein
VRARVDVFAGVQHCAQWIGPNKEACLPESADNPCRDECEDGNSDADFFGCGSSEFSFGAVDALVCEQGTCAVRCEIADLFGLAGEIELPLAAAAAGDGDPDVPDSFDRCASRGMALVGGWPIGTGCCGSEGLCVGGSISASSGECVVTAPADCRAGPDNCVDPLVIAHTQNPQQEDEDHDGLGVTSDDNVTICDPCPADPFNDADEDEVCGDGDNCPTTSNPDQLDFDADDVGDVCDHDVDGDELCNALCPAFGDDGPCGLHGECHEGGCVCDPGWSGVGCEVDARHVIPCPGEPECSGRGVCNVRTGVCLFVKSFVL